MQAPKRYRKRPLTIQAIQWTGANLQAVQDFVGPMPGTDHPAFVYLASTGVGRLYVDANKTWLPIEQGEWVASDSEGFYPIKEGVFATSYEPVG